MPDLQSAVTLAGNSLVLAVSKKHPAKFSGRSKQFAMTMKKWFFRDFLGNFYWSGFAKTWERVEPRLRTFDRRGARAEGSQPAPLLVLTRTVAVLPQGRARSEIDCAGEIEKSATASTAAG